MLLLLLPAAGASHNISTEALFFCDFSAAKRRFVARLSRSDSPQSRGPSPRADPPSSRPLRSASEVARSRLRGLPHAPQSQPCFFTTTSLLYIYVLLLYSPLPAGYLIFFPTRTLTAALTTKCPIFAVSPPANINETK